MNASMLSIERNSAYLVRTEPRALSDGLFQEWLNEPHIPAPALDPLLEAFSLPQIGDLVGSLLAHIPTRADALGGSGSTPRQVGRSCQP
jgi:hypothetical protein